MILAAMILAAATAAPPSVSALKPVRTTVYSFTYSSPAAAAHTGTIHADVLGITQDGGLVVGGFEPRKQRAAQNKKKNQKQQEGENHSHSGSPEV